MSEEPGSLRVPAGEIRERAAAKPKRMGRADVRVSQLAIEALGDRSDEEGEDDSSEASSDGGIRTRTRLPPGWSMTFKTPPNGRKYKVFKGPEGARQMYSLPAAWAEHDRLVGAESDSESVPGLGTESESEPEEGSESVALVEEAPVVPPTPEYFEITPGGCGTKGCTFRHGHDGHGSVGTERFLPKYTHTIRGYVVCYHERGATM